MQDLPPIEGVTPGMLWTALIVLIAGAGLYVLYGKVRETYMRNKQMKNPENRLADEISAKVIEKMEPRFAEIDRKLANDKEQIDAHTRQINTMEKRQNSSDKAEKALCRGVLALLNHELHNGNTDEMEKAKSGIDDYLIEK